MYKNNCADRRTAARGFSLIELMVVVAIVALLASIATASYRNYTRRATRTEGRSVLLAIQVAQEKYFLQNSQYVQTIAGVIAAPPAGLGIPLTRRRHHLQRQLHHQLPGRVGNAVSDCGNCHGRPGQRQRLPGVYR